MTSIFIFFAGFLVGAIVILIGVVAPVGMEVNRLRILNASLKSHIECAQGVRSPRTPDRS